jgi:hypothetical protein
MKTKSLAVGLAIVLLMAVATGCDHNGKAQESQIQFSESYSGSFVSTSIDTNNDGVPANLGTFEGTSMIGTVTTQVTIQSLNEFQSSESVTCPNGNVGFTLVQGHFVKRIANGDLLLGTWESGTSCFDPTTSTSKTTQKGKFIGGTGQFANATGPVEIDYTSTFLANTKKDGFAFGGTTGTGTGTIIIGGQ